MNSRDRGAREIQQAIRDILLREWDPIGVRDVAEAQDEYDAYVGGVYRLLASQASVSDIMQYLARIEREAMGLSGSTHDLTEVAAHLKHIDISAQPT